MRTVDSLCREHFADQQTVALWIDVEGMALDVLTGARQMLDAGRCVALKVEVETDSLWLDQHLAERGYRPVLCDFEYDYQFNAVYVRKELVDAVEGLAQQRLFVLSANRVSFPERLFKSRNYFWQTKKRAKR